jgi:AraC family transcriptional regulator
VETRDRFLQGIDYIEEHLLEPVRLTDAAASAGLSPHHYSRLFRILTGETFGAYLRRRRLTVAAERLAEQGADVRLVDLALSCQYDSQEAFTRAFKRMFGRPPGAFRASAPVVRQHWRGRIDAAALGHLSEVLEMEPELVEIESFTVVGVRERFDQDQKHRIPDLWGRFLEVAASISHRKGEESFGVCIDADLENGAFDYLAGFAVTHVDALPDGIVAAVIPRQFYAVFKHHQVPGDLHQSLQATMRWIFGTWLPQSSYRIVRGPDFERYPPRFEPGAPGQTIDICIPVEPCA